MSDKIFEIIESDFHAEKFKEVITTLDNYLNDNPNDLNALKWKVKILSFDEQCEEALKLCNNLIDMYASDIELLNDKVLILMQMSKYREAILICNNILKIDPKNCEAKSTLSTLKVLKENENLNKSLNFITNNKIAIIFIILFTLIYYHPTKEVMNCNSNYTCTVEQEFIDLIKIHKEIRISNKSIISNKFQYDFSSRRRYQNYLSIDNKKPFIMYLDKSEINDLEHDYAKIEDRFYKYLMNPEKCFEIKSYADGFSCYLLLSIFLIFVFCLNWFKKPVE